MTGTHGVVRKINKRSSCEKNRSFFDTQNVTDEKLLDLDDDKDGGIYDDDADTGGMQVKPSTNPLTPGVSHHFHDELLQCVYPHILSYNTLVDFYVKEMILDLPTIYVVPGIDNVRHESNPYYKPEDYLKIGISDVSVGRPQRFDLDFQKWFDGVFLPRQCREAHVTYGAPLYVSFVCERKADVKSALKKKMLVGLLPVMVKSNRCSLYGMSPSEMQAAGEDVDELGGYFLINGNERVIRFVIQQKTNYPIALKRDVYKSRDVFATDCFILLRSQRLDGTCTTNILVDTEDGRCSYRILLNRQEHFCPFMLILRAVAGNLSKEQFKAKFMQGTWGDRDEVICLHALFEEIWGFEQEFVDIDIMENRYLNRLGKFFWRGISWLLPPGSTYDYAGRYIIDHYVLVHIKEWNSKFELLLVMFKKLRLLRTGKISPESMDAFSHQEVVLPGQILSAVLKDALFTCLTKIRLQYMHELNLARQANQDPMPIIESVQFFDTVTEKCSGDIAHKINYFMATGNIRTTQMDLQQLSGWTITGDRLNIHRFISHFRAVHRGQFFTQMKTTAVRKLLSETWGFLCPVHTPDGSPCGLLLHLAQMAQPVALPPDKTAAAVVKLFLQCRSVCVDLVGASGLPVCDNIQAQGTTPDASMKNSVFPLLVDGGVICYLPSTEFDYWLEKLKETKARGLEGFKPHWELVGFSESSSQYSSIYIFTLPGRVMRPVRHLASGRVEFIGPLQQPWESIACRMEQIGVNERAALAHLPIVEECLKTSDLKNEEGGDIQENSESLNKSYNNLELSYRDVLNGIKGASCLDHINPKHCTDNALPKPNEAASMLMTRHVPVKYKYVELSPTCFLSIAAALTPFCNHNQSPRNIYQCQMLKQTMGTPFHNAQHRYDNKAYRLITPQRPLVRTNDYRKFDFDDYPSGVNAVVGIACYTGFDMEDAMILNKSAVERGLFTGCVYKTKIVDAVPPSAKSNECSEYMFRNTTATGRRCLANLDIDGFPYIGAKIKNEGVYCRVQRNSKQLGSQMSSTENTYKDDEPAYVDGVTVTAPMDQAAEKLLKSKLRGPRAAVRLRCIRKPIIGDKFASRHGQKGILALLWPTEDMPFSESGLVPDILFNPHGFPSRMTIGMMIESMAGKAAALHGSYQDASGFRRFPQQRLTGNRWIDQEGHHGWILRNGRYRTKDEEFEAKEKGDTPIDFFGKALLQAGYQYYGKEELYSGVFGRPLTAHIFTGLIYYQRLRHMVTDKAQVRATGPIDSLTHQPVHGRKRHGGVRFGEMERDALISHGAAALLQDRLQHCSDSHKTFCCPKCGSFLSTDVLLSSKTGATSAMNNVPYCKICKVPCRLIALPYAFRYLCNELAAMNVTVRLELSDCCGLVAVPSPAKLEEKIKQEM